ncbi:hypothetical protein JOM56_005097 [Amanita muscaria]
MGTSRLTRLASAHARIDLIRKYLKEGNFTLQSFVNPASATMGSDQYLYRAGILKELESIAENLHFPLIDPIRDLASPEFWKAADRLYGVRSVVVHRYGVTELDYYEIWNWITDVIENVIEPTIKVLAEQIEGVEKHADKHLLNLLSLIQDD